MGRILCIACCLSCVSAAQAEIIIDDFDDTAIVVNVGPPPVTTVGVGILDGRREIGIAVGLAETEAAMDVNVTFPSQLAMDMVSITPTSTAGGLVFFSLSYDFDSPADFTEDLRNDTLFLDFDSLTGITPPPLIHFNAFESVGVSWSFNIISPVPTSDTPFTIAVPLDSFRSRDGSTLASLENVIQFDIWFRANEFFGAPDELGWTALLDRIRVGRVPEPSTLILAMFALAFVLHRRFR